MKLIIRQWLTSSSPQGQWRENRSSQLLKKSGVCVVWFSSRKLFLFCGFEHWCMFFRILQDAPRVPKIIHFVQKWSYFAQALGVHPSATHVAAEDKGFWVIRSLYSSSTWRWSVVYSGSRNQWEESEFLKVWTTCLQPLPPAILWTFSL